MKYVAILAMLIATTPVAAATLCMSITSPTYTGTRCGMVPDVGIPAFFAAYASSYGTVIIPAVKNNTGDIITPETTRQATNDEEFKAFASGIAKGIANNITQYLKSTNAKIASDKIDPIIITPVP